MNDSIINSLFDALDNARLALKESKQKQNYENEMFYQRICLQITSLINTIEIIG